jgi:hypothetical protein
MRQLNCIYTQIYNRRHRIVGHVFQGRYKAILIQEESHILEGKHIGTLLTNWTN